MNQFHFNDEDDAQLKQLINMLPDNYAVVYRADGRVRINKVGLSFTALFFGILPAWFRGDWYNVFCMLGVEAFFTMLYSYLTGSDLATASYQLGIFFNLLWFAIYNLMYFRHSQNLNYQPYDRRSAQLLQQHHYYR
ncbi:hypothetical protein M3M35_03800 [Fructilactobacillus myrtifloralis]|uniref:DUF2628 domain-containing protein n=1 Tax=Fructilactobacillus myrtifloralis TaxID=2940301 RepID=A0ABY5BLA4_9LACO|nr:hypothetical protein [Fructilactobacillus myrtifloralis]USS84450.1 hypothetical protein M3M35_03800 [Fructilactobacillus myrtifloralis]